MDVCSKLARNSLLAVVLATFGKVTRFINITQLSFHAVSALTRYLSDSRWT